MTVENVILRFVHDRGLVSEAQVYHATDQQFYSVAVMTLLDLEERGLVKQPASNWWEITAKGRQHLGIGGKA